MNRIRQHLTYTSLLAVALIAIPSSAAAGTKSARATASGSFSIATATAKCPSGQRATGGGFAAPGSIAANVSFYVYESRKIGQRSWRASGQVFEIFPSGTNFTLTTFVYCSEDAPSTKAKSASVTATSGTRFFTADARCSSGKAQAGGFIGPPPKTGNATNHLVQDSYRTDKKTWRSRMDSVTPGISFASFVYCAEQKKPAARSAALSSAGNPLLVTVPSAECKRGTNLVAGGFSQPGATTLPSSKYEVFYESFKVGKRWQVSARHTGTSTTLNSIAYCA